MTDPLLSSLMESVTKYIHKESDLKQIEKAYFLARDRHDGVARKSGEPYITHPVAVAKILADLEVGPNTLIAGLLHDTIEDTDLSFEDIKREFSDDVATLVDGVTKIRKIVFSENREAENQQKMLLAMAKDIRVIIIKIADRLHNLRTLDSMPSEKQEKTAKETLEIYAPIAHRLGMFRIKAELEDRSLKYTNPSMYYNILGAIQTTKKNRESSIERIIAQISEIFKENGVLDFEIKGRIKNIYSIYKKMVVNKKAIEDIYDLLAIRIIVDKIEECYQVLGLIHASFTPIPRRFKDYIAVPKPNLYQSLHTTVIAEDGTLFEVQIRTHRMDEIAEYGIAAHWAYKENKVYSKEKEQFEIAQKLKWYGELLRMTEDSDDNSSDSKEFIDTIKGDILDANVYVFTPNGEVIELPKGSTPIDFAYRIHTDLGHKMSGATVNNRIVPLSYELKTGDIVSVKTNKNSIGPSEDWLKIAKSSHARHKIKGFLNKQNKDQLIIQGKEALLQELKQNNISEIPNDLFVRKHFEKNMLLTQTDMFFEIGKGLLSPKTVVAKINGTENSETNLQRQMDKTAKILSRISETGVIVDGLDNPQVKLANCCYPIPGDDILGYISKGNGIAVHTAECPNVQTLDKKRFIEVYWSENINRKYPSRLKIIGSHRHGLISDVITAINAMSVSIAEINAVNTSQLETVIKLKVSITDIHVLLQMIANIKKVPDIYVVERGIK
ncbi:bifunctional (p)ppGpp synthetase/guanosine-3',5'-bis(diphosphate) 3'-pyrophosphohydrolase [Acholeplasma sp. OttesenSCG-928-E16]|nr:bifunctional (p)ppGpp synthetase/guanosine-3',5'-bis(diphosphate) 3'-pyrophosphohydrolase [Acholeplasma sp. OttesenSCG-928-E16]